MVCVTGGNLAWRGTSTRDGGKDDGQMEVFVQGEQELRGGLLHWGSAKNRVVNRSELVTSSSTQSHQGSRVAT